MASILRDIKFQEHLIAFLCKDRHFLKRISGLLEPDDFKPKKGEDRSLYLIAKKALDFYATYDTPIGGLLRTEMMDVIHNEKMHPKSRTKLLDMVGAIQKNHNLVAVGALEARVKQFKQRKIRRAAVEKLAEMEESGDLTTARFQEIVDNTLQKIGEGKVVVTDYASQKGFKKRMMRRQKNKDRSHPFLLIDELDVKVKTTPRGTLGLLLAKYNVGKTAMFVHLAIAFAIQSLNVLIVTLEDGAEEYEDRLDANLTNVEINKLVEVPNKVRRRFRKIKNKLRGHIRIVDGSEGGMTVGRIKQIWEQERNRNFTADVILIDYDDELESVQQYKGENAKIQKFTEVYRDLRRLAKKTNTWTWIAAQAKRGKGDEQMVVTGDDTADDIGKVRKAWMGIGIGFGPKEWENLDARHLFIMRHRSDQARFGVTIVGNFKKGIFYDRERTMEMKVRIKGERFKHHED